MRSPRLPPFPLAGRPPRPQQAWQTISAPALRRPSPSPLSSSWPPHQAASASAAGMAADSQRALHFQFYRSPTEVLVDPVSGATRGLRVERTALIRPSAGGPAVAVGTGEWALVHSDDLSRSPMRSPLPPFLCLHTSSPGQFDTITPPSDSLPLSACLAFQASSTLSQRSSCSSASATSHFRWRACHSTPDPGRCRTFKAGCSLLPAERWEGRKTAARPLVIPAAQPLLLPRITPPAASSRGSTYVAGSSVGQRAS